MNVHGDVARKTEESEALAALRRFARSRPAVERCELCGAVLAPDHTHLLNRESRQVACGCDACAVLFSRQERSKYLRIPQRVRRLADFAFSDLEWEAMMLPIHLAFFLRDSEGRIVAMYPSPAGAVQSELGMALLEQKFAGQAELRRMEPEVETLLVNRAGMGDYFVAPIDECYRLVGLIRMKWRGLSGGAEVEAAIENFFSDLKRRAGETACPS